MLTHTKGPHNQRAHGDSESGPITPGSKIEGHEEPPHLYLSLAEPASTTSTSIPGTTARKPALSGMGYSPPHPNPAPQEPCRTMIWEVRWVGTGLSPSFSPQESFPVKTGFSFLETDPLIEPLAFLGLGSSSVEMIESFKPV